MEENNKKNLDHKSAQRFQEFLNILGLTPIGMGAFLEISSDHIYSLRKGRRSIGDNIALSLVEKLGINLADVYNPNFKLKKSKISTQFLNKFIYENKSSLNYFEDQKEKRSLTIAIRINLLNQGFFQIERSSNEVVAELKKLGHSVNSERATKSLKYLVEIGFLKSEKRNIITRTGTIGTRKVNYYSGI
jgi:DNA-binding XRE family transcriptional regulator